MEQHAHQPDFGLVAANLSEIATHLSRCAHLPAVDGGARLAERMDLMMEQLAGLRQTVQQGFTDLGQRMGTLDRKVTASNKNFTARTRNSVVTHRTVDLSPLCNAITAEPIEGFPRKLGDLESLSIRQVDALLRELGEPVQGSADDRRRWLKYAVGVTTQVV
ncbi:hypothetical protein GQ602_002945 [Ophiocordyceps camponoti-floridani]|uniref:Uncharacterized protein n=1 Tax=Ophiocordyceps camponoti-floridani TaxID=2030778 RepID=A0A8H4Q764_9HYPO|nr:hypothetical protein GQ602_002945 [Ophiocordyceps camponoti-floridani]